MQDILDDIKALSERERAEDFEWHVTEIAYLAEYIQNLRTEDYDEILEQIELKIEVGAAYLSLGYSAKIFEGAAQLLTSLNERHGRIQNAPIH